MSDLKEDLGALCEFQRSQDDAILIMQAVLYIKTLEHQLEVKDKLIELAKHEIRNRDMGWPVEQGGEG